MKIAIVIQREKPGGGAWATECADQYTYDEWGDTPDHIKKATDSDPANSRIVWIEVPDDTYCNAFKEPTVVGEVVKP